MNFQDLKTNLEKVEMLLIKYPQLKDNDNRLIAFFWYNQIGKKINDISGYDFLKYFSNGNLTNPETIRRIRQKLQEKNPGLRGEKYNNRKSAGDDFRKNINDL